MKRFLCYILILIPLVGRSQVSDDFSDGDFSVDPRWTGDTSQFEVNSSGQLHLKAAVADTTILYTSNSMAIDNEWDFWIKLSFNTSVNNFARVYLVSDKPDLKGRLNGYYLQIGGSSDSVVLFRQNDDLHTPILRLASSFTGNSVNIFRFRITRDSDGKWTVYADNSGNTAFREEGSCMDKSITGTVNFGFYCRFTSSNAAKFYFDDIYIGPVHVDSIPPEIQRVGILSENTVSVVFSETIDETEAEKKANYFVPGHGSPDKASLDSLSGSNVFLTFPAAFDQGSCDTLVVITTRDLFGNEANNLRQLFCNHHTGTYDIVISEIMADPTPQTGLPDAEYAELFNRSSFSVSLKDWTFAAGQTVKTFPDIHMDPGEYLILSKSDLLSYYGRTLVLFTSSATLPNEGSVLTLRNEKGAVIHSVSYSQEWYRNSGKKEGGWSLEMADPGNPCGCAGNWQASEHILGGTPGAKNSISRLAPDSVAPYVVRVNPENDSLLIVVFSESIDSTSLQSASQWHASGGPEISGMAPVAPLYKEIRLFLSGRLNPGTIYHLDIPGGIRDCAGNMTGTDMSARFALPDSVSFSDLVINEVLPDPYPDGERFVELYNRSGKAIDLRHLVLMDTDTGPEEEADPVSITDDGYMVFPGEYAVITRNPADILARYYVPCPDCFITVSSIPGMTGNDSGNVVLARKNDLAVVDRVSYTSAMNFPLLSSPEGVSLERINPDSPSADKGNWHSAAASSGYATPGYLNSQCIIPGVGDGFVSLEPEIFSPDNDGRNDIVFIRIRPDRPGFIANLRVFSTNGTLVRHLGRNEMMAAESGFSWDGITDENSKAPAGIYIILAEFFHPDGETRRLKLPVVLAASF